MRAKKANQNSCGFENLQNHIIGEIFEQQESKILLMPRKFSFKVTEPLSFVMSHDHT